MLKFLWCWIVGSSCKWKTIRENNLNMRDDGEVIATGYRYVQQCETCGKIKFKDVI